MIRELRVDDITAGAEVIDSTQLFPAELLTEMTSSYFADNPAQQRWLVYERDGRIIALAFYAPEEMAEGTYNLYLIAVHQDFQGTGVGSELMAAVEGELGGAGHRILLVETSGIAEFAATRAFYRKLAYTEEATIRDFYAAGEDKVVFWKRLST